MYRIISIKTILTLIILFAFVFQIKSQEVNNNLCTVSDSLKGTFWDPSLSIDKRVDDLVGKLNLEEKVSLMMYNSPAIDRLGIPAYNWWGECLHGVARNGRATVFPQAIGLASTFDEDLIYRIASAISDEARAKFKAQQELGVVDRYTGLTFWTPNINIYRDPRWGRGQETYGEDPYLTATLGVAFVKGLQGNNPKYLKAAGCAKHFVVHSGPESLRHVFNAVPSKKDFFETYTPAFEALAKDAKVEGFMCAYNRTFEEPCCGNNYLLTELLRNQWGFDGYITSDCWALVDFYQGHKVVATPEEAAAKALKAGVELNCGSVFYPYLINAQKKGLISESEIDQRLKHLLKTRFKLGLFDPISCNPYNDITEDVICSIEHKKLALEAAEKSIVLLKNKNNILPLPKNLKNIYVMGPNVTSAEALIGNYYGQSNEYVTFLAGITAKIHPGTKLEYRYAFLPDGKNMNTIDYTPYDAANADVTICIMGLSGLFEGEEGESVASTTHGDRLNLKLPDNQINYLRKVRKILKDKPLIVVITAGSPIEMTTIDSIADAILYAWYPGEQGGAALGNLIFGDAVPSGRLPITFPKSLSQLPDYNDYSMENRTYKYMKSDPMYPFGFGLSYSQFEYSQVTTNAKSYKDGQTIIVQASIKNAGKYKADEVAQLYVSVPKSNFRVPIIDLKDIKRVTIEPGQTTSISFELPVSKLYSIDNDGNKVLLKGEYKIFVGGTAPTNRSIELGASQWKEINIKIY